MKSKQIERKSLWRRLWMRRGVLVQDRDGRVRRMLIKGRATTLGRAQAAVLGVILAEQLPI